VTGVYRYEAARSDGRVVKGRLEASTAPHAAAVLLERGLQPIRLDAAEPSASGTRAAPRRDLAIAFRGLAALSAAGVPLEKAIAATEGLTRGSLRSCLAGARARLHDGCGVAQAFEDESGTVPPLVVGMLRAGERTGRLDATLGQVASHLEREADLIARIRHALAYPALLLVAGLASVVIIGTLVVPKFAALLDDMGQRLPPATRLLLAGSAFFTGHWPALLLSLGVALALFTGWLRTAAGRSRFHRYMLALPVLGPLRHGLAMVRVCRGLGGALEAGMPLLPALDTARDAAGDLAIASRVVNAKERVARGEPLASALGKERVLAGGPLQLAAVGESSGQLGIMLLGAGDLAAQESERGIGAIVTLIEPLLVVLLGGLVAFVAAALLQAVYSLRPAA
jgi:type II secretory pathway component PulF